MGRAETLAAVREKYPQYADMPDDVLGNSLADKYPGYADLRTPPAPGWLDRVMDVASAPIRAGRSFMYGGLKDPETIAKEARQLTAQTAAIPATMAAGALAGAAVPVAAAPYAAAAGRVGATGGMSLARGEDWWHTAIDMAGAIIGETAAGGLNRAVSKVIAPSEKALASTMGDVAKRVGAKTTGYKVFDVGGEKMYLNDAIAAVKAAPASERDALMAKLVAQMNRMDPDGRAGNLFLDAVNAKVGGKLKLGPVSVEMPEWAVRGAETVAPVLASPVARSGLDVLFGQSPFSALAVNAVSSMARPLSRHVPGGKYLDDLIAEEADDSSGH